ncbi:hypothetical protein K431DRAFT_283232 [Polychaeton citri CBS 116435]|uniref:Heterokaryon incompatibility domain-containing protein n=1 Tax=Polychaeton citri CBS 116435 TaxID=1314669 RepID=A0A9P4QE79_9PEZI|nr:hypothetical protein K431DRAFT_283232 [Polychaeton citri CBS 116435]
MSLYTALSLPHEDSIRLCKITGIDDEGVPQIHLSTARLRNPPDYSAISYTWKNAFCKPRPGAAPGPEDAPKKVKCDGYEITVGGNLHSALLQLYAKPELREGSFWIDAICIDQQNDVERGYQVNLMSDIYSQAVKVIIWLGLEDEHALPAFQLMEALSQQPRGELLAITESTLATDQSLGEGFNDISRWKSLARFFCRSWFTRAWVVQEALLARQILVLCGQHEIEWEKVAHVSGFLATGPWTRVFPRPDFVGAGMEPHHGGPAKLAATKRSLVRDGQADHVLLYSLIRSRKYDCRMDVDKVFSLLGLARVTAAPGVSFPRPDYTVSTRGVYIQAALSILDNDDDLLVLCSAEGPAFRQIPDLPSWVPDWSVTQLVGLGITGYKRFDAAEGKRRNLQIDRVANKLDIEAYRLDSIVQTGESKLDVDKDGAFPGWLEILAKLPAQYFTGQASTDVLWRTLLTNTVTNHEGKPQTPAPEEFREAFLAWLLQKSERWDSQPPDKQEQLNQLLSDLAGASVPSSDPASSMSSTIQRTPTELRTLEDRYDTPFSHALCLRLFRTEQNLLGIGSLSVDAGDSVWIVPGCPVPLMFRRLTPTSRVTAKVDVGEYELVGAAYVHGVMHGKAFGRGLEAETIRIV